MLAPSSPRLCLHAGTKLTKSNILFISTEKLGLLELMDFLLCHVYHCMTPAWRQDPARSCIWCDLTYLCQNNDYHQMASQSESKAGSPLGYAEMTLLGICIVQCEMIDIAESGYAWIYLFWLIPEAPASYSCWVVAWRPHSLGMPQYIVIWLVVQRFSSSSIATRTLD